MKILRYTEAIQKQIGSKTKPEPWLHVCMHNGLYAIYVWDTRKVLESGNATVNIDFDGSDANDNHEQLVGDNTQIVNRINTLLVKAGVKYRVMDKAKFDEQYGNEASTCVHNHVRFSKRKFATESACMSENANFWLVYDDGDAVHGKSSNDTLVLANFLKSTEFKDAALFDDYQYAATALSLGRKMRSATDKREQERLHKDFTEYMRNYGRRFKNDKWILRT